MARCFEHDGAVWEVELTGTGGEGCGAHILEVVFRCPSDGRAVAGRVAVSGTGRLSDALLQAALADALEADG